MSPVGHERRPLRVTAARRLPLCLVSDRIGAALQYVAQGQLPTLAWLAPVKPGWPRRLIRRTNMPSFGITDHGAGAASPGRAQAVGHTSR
jgi:hypothetical protein